MSLKTSARFWSKVDKMSNSNGCWIWTGTKNKRGYGKFRHTTNQNDTLIYAHRYAYQLKNGTISNNDLVCHKCDNPSCVNPDHLFIGSQKDNMSDASQKGHARKGKMNRFQVARIVTMCASGVPQEKIAKQFDISQSQVSLIKLGKLKSYFTYSGEK